MNNNIILTENQMQSIKNEWNEEYRGHYEDGCLCGYYEGYIENIGYLTIDTHCHKSSECPENQDWIVEDDIYVWNNSIFNYGCRPTEEDLKEDDNLKLLGFINKEQTKEIKDIVRKSIIRDYSWNGHTDEFGNDINVNTEDRLLEFRDKVNKLMKEYNVYINVNQEYDYDWDENLVGTGNIEISIEDRDTHKGISLNEDD